MTTAQRRVRRIVKKLQDYMSTYDQQPGYLNYTDETIIEDILYGLGIALEPKKHRCANGFSVFKKQLAKHLGFRAKGEAFSATKPPGPSEKRAHEN